MSHPTPVWAVAPFVAYLVLLAVLPLVWGHFWEKNRNKVLVAAVASIPSLAFMLGVRAEGVQLFSQTVRDYLAFLALLAALFTISGGIHVRGSLSGGVATNLTFLGIGALLANLIGTTGASVLLIRPLLRANRHRRFATHVVVFFIFIVSNGGGLLTPLGDPPLFLGFLRGVPFAWTLRLAGPWALVNGLLLALFLLFELYHQAREARHDWAPADSQSGHPLRLEGALNLLWLLGLVLGIFCLGTFGRRVLPSDALLTLGQLVITVGFAALSLLTTPSTVRKANVFGWAPMLEVAAVFLGIFLTMAPALGFLEERGASLGLTLPGQFFWASGALSSVLDNAPTYLTFTSLARGVLESGGTTLATGGVGALATHPVGQRLLSAISCGSVFMGAMTYIGNGPNFMVKSIAEEHHVRMPTFFAYLLWSLAILIPIFLLVSKIFF